MLTTTYSIAVLSGEQQGVHHALVKLDQCLDNAPWNGAGAIDIIWLENLFDRLMATNRRCHARKIERYVIPMIRKTTCEADDLIEKIELLGTESVRILRCACEQIRRAIDGGDVNVESLISIIDVYCELVLERLRLEETELFPVALQSLSGDEWFQIAEHCLSETETRRRGSQQAFALNVHNKERTQYRYLH